MPTFTLEELGCWLGADSAIGKSSCQLGSSHTVGTDATKARGSG